MAEEFSLFGRLADIRFPELILKVSERKETGVLHLSRAEIEKNVYFLHGKIVFAQSNDPDERLGPLFLRRDKVSYRQLVDAADKVAPGKRLGTILVLDGHITPSDLYQGVIDQIKEILYSMFDWEDGLYEFRPGDLPSEEVITLNLSIPDILISGLARIWRWSWIREGSISLDAVVRKREGWSLAARKMTITPEIQSLLELLDRPRTLGEILHNSKLGNFETCRLIWGMLLLGVAEQILLAPSGVLPAIERETVEMSNTAVLEPPPVIKISEPPTIKTEVFPAEIPEEAEEQTVAVKLTEETAEPTMVMEKWEAVGEEKPVVEEQPAEQTIDEALTVQPESLETFPPGDLSFSDLADLTDVAEQLAPAPVSTPPPQVSWEKELPADIKMLNEQHRYLFEMLRLELGSGVNPFLSKMLKKVSTKFPLVFDGVRLNDFGEFEEGTIIANVEGNFVEKYRDAFQYLLNEELTSIHTFLDQKRAASIENGLARMSEKRKVVS